jgi:ketosteroid isomerase-like protein
MLYRSPADFCAEYAKAHSRPETDATGDTVELDEVAVVSETPDTARVVASLFHHGHAPDAGYYDVFERIAFVLVKRDDGWHLDSEEHLGYDS